jgi:hypothetical protein
MDKTKRGIALFITLLVIASILSIVAVSFSYLGKVQKDTGKISALIQGNLFYRNSVDILKHFFPKGKVDTRKLQMIYTLPLMLSEEESDFNINLRCKPLMSGVPIQWLDEKFSPKKPQKLDLAMEVLTKVMQRYEIKEPNSLEELILGAISREDEDINSEYRPRLKSKKGFLSKREFNKILLEYRLKYDDVKVFLIPWDKYFVFTEIAKTTVIDGVYITPELISIIADMPLDSVIEEWKTTDSDFNEKKMTLKEFLSQNGMEDFFDKSLYSEKPFNAMRCEEIYMYRDRYYSFSFEYLNERNRDFEFNGEI